MSQLPLGCCALINDPGRGGVPKSSWNTDVKRFRTRAAGMRRRRSLFEAGRLTLDRWLSERTRRENEAGAGGGDKSQRQTKPMFLCLCSFALIRLSGLEASGGQRSSAPGGRSYLQANRHFCRPPPFSSPLPFLLSFFHMPSAAAGF